jgi:uncharacterized membrane protein YgcG
VAACLADVGLAKQAPLQLGATHMTTGAVRGTPGLLDPLLTNGMEHSPLTDGYAFGITCLVTLVARPAVGLRQHCKLMLKTPLDPERWTPPQPPTNLSSGSGGSGGSSGSSGGSSSFGQRARARALPDASAGDWPVDVACGLLEIVCGLTEEYKEDRMPMDEALERLQAMLLADHPTPSSRIAPCAPPMHERVTGWLPAHAMPAVVVSLPALREEAPAGPAGQAEPAGPAGPAEEPRLCVVCDERPRTVRFSCGHACCCDGCAARVRRGDGLCPTCRAPLGSGDADRGTHVASAPTFCMQPTPPGHPVEGVRGAGRSGGGRGGSGGRGGRGA